MPRKCIVSQTYLKSFILLSLGIATSVGWDGKNKNFQLEQPFRHPDCPLVDDPMHPIQLPYPSDCNKYYTCKNGYAYAMLCQNELQWSVTTYRCDFPSVAKCGGTIPFPIDTTAGGAQPTPQSVIFKADPKDCSRFYSCMPMRCPPSQYWNRLLNRCDAPQNTLCDAQIWTQSPFIDNSIPTASTPPAYSQGELMPAPIVPAASLLTLCNTPGVDYVRHPNDCHKFIQCDGLATVHTCANNLYWNSEVMACDRYCK